MRYCFEMLTGMRCTERGRLLLLYSEATARLSDKVTSLAEASSSCERAVFDRAWEECEEARHLCTQIQEQIYDHFREHRCALEVPTRGARPR
jgi:hypothetical protein